MNAHPIDTLDRFCVYGVATDYDDMIELVRYRVEELATTHESVDAVAGIPAGYFGKVVAPQPIKSMGKLTMGPVLQTLGLALIVVRDDEQFARLKDRLAKRKRVHNLPPIAGKVRPTWLFKKKKAREMGKKRFALMTPAQLKRHQRKAQKGQAAARRRKRMERERASRIQPATPV
jgi:hypothetical protein